jgi:hypothetical protein
MANRQSNLKNRISRLTATLVMVGIGVVGVGFFVAVGLLDLSENYRGLFIGVGASLVGSSVASTLLFILVEPWRDSALEDVIREVRSEQIAKERREYFEPKYKEILKSTEQIKAAVERNRHEIVASAEQNYQRIESRALVRIDRRELLSRDAPFESFPAADHLKVDYNRLLARYFASSSRYSYYGATAVFTAFRFSKLRESEAVRSFNRVRISIVDPSDDVAVDAVSERVNRSQEEICREVLLTLCAFYDIRMNVSAEVYLHADIIGRRLELFDDVVFETLYVGDDPYPSTDVYRKGSRRYAANQGQIDETAKRRKGVGFGSTPTSPQRPLINDEREFIGLLRRLGYDFSHLSSVRAERDERFDGMHRELIDAGIGDGEIF